MYLSCVGLFLPVLLRVLPRRSECLQRLPEVLHHDWARGIYKLLITTEPACIRILTKTSADYHAYQAM